MSPEFIGIYYDTFTSVCDKINPGPTSKKVTVNQITTNLASKVVEKVNLNYALEPPLSVENDMSLRYFTEWADGDADVSSVDGGLITLVTPKPDSKHVKRTANHWDALNKENKALKQKNDELEGEAGQGTAGLDHGDFISLKKIMADLQAMVAQQQDALEKEKVDRKAEMTKEKVDRKAEMAKEKVDRKVQVAGLQDALAKEKADRKAEVAKEKADRKAEMALRIGETNRLEKQLENLTDENDQLFNELQSKQNRLTKEMNEHVADVRYISELTLRLIPLHLRVLLDHTRRRVLLIMGFDSWTDLIKGQSVEQVTTAIVLALEQAGIQDAPPRDSILYLCSYNNVRKDGDFHAHNATQEEVRDAILTKRLDSQDRTALMHFFQFVFGEPA